MHWICIQVGLSYLDAMGVEKISCLCWALNCIPIIMVVLVGMAAAISFVLWSFSLRERG
jgi:uncharacterized membrane protein